MKKIILTAAAMSLGIMLAAAGTAGAQTRATVIKPSQATSTQMKLAPIGGTSQARDNTAHAWTAGCYAEFGPNATHPDAALLEKCLNW
jgi:hypothetical protein